MSSGSHVALVTEECPKHFEDFIVRIRAKNSKFPGKFGSISGSKRSLSLCNTVLHFGILWLREMTSVITK